MIELYNVHKVFRTSGAETVALDALSLTLAEGSLTTIAGPSGSGKSTLLNMIGGLDRPDGGEVLLRSTPIHSYGESRLARYRLSNIGFIFQAFHLIPHLTVYNNVALPAQLLKTWQPSLKQRIFTLLERLGVEGQHDKLPHQLSGGQQQRVAIARALVNDPWLLLADEPTGNLDSEAGARVLALLGELHAAGKTLLIVTHDPAIAASGERRLVLRDGAIVADQGSPATPERRRRELQTA